MYLEMLKSKIHRVTVTDKSLHYVGSITIDEDLMNASGILEHEKVHVFDINNGSRFETYVIKGQRGSGEICVNGAAAHLVEKGNLVIIVAYGFVKKLKASKVKAKIINVDKNNRMVKFSEKVKKGVYDENERDC